VVVLHFDPSEQAHKQKVLVDCTMRSIYINRLYLPTLAYCHHPCRVLPCPVARLQKQILKAYFTEKRMGPRFKTVARKNLQYSIKVR
jgi:hypothetical protein